MLNTRHHLYTDAFKYFCCYYHLFLKFKGLSHVERMPPKNEEAKIWICKGKKK